MKNNCDMARDLMPLTIDGVASEASRNYVNEHLEECEACRAYLAGMKAALDDNSQRAAQEKKSFDQTAARMKHRRFFRKVAILLTALTLAFGALFAGTMLYNQLRMELPSENCQVSLTQLKNGQVVVMVTTSGEKPCVGYGVSEKREQDGSYVMQLIMETYRFGHKLKAEETKPVANILTKVSLDGIDRIEYGGDKAVCWEKGDAITPASAEMEAYYKACDDLDAYGRQLAAAHGATHYDMTSDEAKQWAELLLAIREAKAAVPEWIGLDALVGARYTPPMGMG